LDALERLDRPPLVGPAAQVPAARLTTMAGKRTVHEMSGQFLAPRSGGHLESGETLLAARGMPRDLLRQASHRLELASLVLAAVYAFTLVLNNSLRAAGWELRPHALLHNVVGATMIAVSMIVAWLSRRGAMEPQRLLDLGL